MNIQSILSDKIKQAMIAAGADEQCDALIRQSGKPQFGDYQANGIMAAAKKLGLNPREFAQKVLDHADLSDVAEKTEIAGPGFINIFLNPTWLANNVSAALKDQNLGVSVNEKQTIVIDYSSPNVAKEMHAAALVLCFRKNFRHGIAHGLAFIANHELHPFQATVAQGE